MSDTATPEVRARGRIVEVLDQFVPDGDFVVREVASKAREHLEANETETLELWLHEELDLFLADVLRRRLQSRRSHAMWDKPAKFAEAADEFDETGNETVFDQVLEVGNLNWRKVGDLDGDHLGYVAEHYEGRARANKMEAEFYRAVQRKVGKKTVREVFTVERFQYLRKTICGEQAA